jgi:DNA-binding transcriptional regulator YiaG
VEHFFGYQFGMTPEQCRAARAWLGLLQDDLATAAGVGLSTLRDFEKGKRNPIGNNRAAIQAVLESKGISFVDGEGTSGITYAKIDRTNSLDGK